ncbi:ParA family protein [Shewanella algae]|uniref:ParA family protein n=1 Tax=Shewanella algae TaxID=38313 RepID=UPI0031F4A00C
MAKTICFFNNKGGVGKTTTSTNIAAGLAQRYRKKVLYIDLDPQCNSTLLITGEDYVAEKYWEHPETSRTILNIVEPILDDEPSINFKPEYILEYAKYANRFGVDLIMGHPRLSAIEDRLGEAWVKVPGGEVGALRKTNWCNNLVASVGDKYDYILIDLGPSLGALNRSALIASDYFVTPMSIDIFSIIGLKNIKSWLEDWSEKYLRGLSYFVMKRPEDCSRFKIKQKIDIQSGCLGYTTQTYASRKNKNGEKRPTQAYERILNQFDAEFVANLGEFLIPSCREGNHILGEIPNMFSLAPIAQSNSSPIRDLKGNDGIFGAHYSQAKEYAELFDKVAERLIYRIEGQQQ